MALAATAILAASCAKEVMTKDAFEQGVFVKRTITADAGLPGADNTDKAYIDDSRKVKWQANDELSINGTALRVYSRDSGDVRAKFYGEVKAYYAGGNDNYWAVYPKGIVPTYAGSGNLPSVYNNTTELTFTLPATQTINTSKQNLEEYAFMAGHAAVPQNQDRIDFQMRNLGAVLKLNLKPKSGNASNRVDSIVFLSTNANLSGSFKVNMSNANNPTVSEVSGNHRLVVKFTDGNNNYISITGNKIVYVFLPPLTNKQLSMRIYGGSTAGRYFEKTIASKTYNRNNVYAGDVADVTFDKPYLFSVSATLKVAFSPGNLQWSSSNGTNTATTHKVAGGGTKAGTWRFALNPWDFVGTQNNGKVGNVYGVGGNTSTICNNTDIGENYRGWIDLFGWATSGVGLGPWSTSTGNSAYGGNGNNNITGTYKNYDWGVYNAIYNPQTYVTDPPGTWRTLTESEWNYLLFSRGGQRYAKATVNGVKGLIIMPDGWSTSTYTLNNRNTANSNFSSNTITAAQWTTLEKSGCVFIPACGYRYKRSQDTYVTRVVSGTTVYIWTATKVDANCARHLRCEDGHLEFNSGSTNAGMGRAEGFAVRLARNH